MRGRKSLEDTLIQKTLDGTDNQFGMRRYREDTRQEWKEIGILDRTSKTRTRRGHSPRTLVRIPEIGRERGVAERPRGERNWCFLFESRTGGSSRQRSRCERHEPSKVQLCIENKACARGALAEGRGALGIGVRDAAWWGASDVIMRHRIALPAPPLPRRAPLPGPGQVHSPIFTAHALRGRGKSDKFYIFTDGPNQYVTS